VPEGQVTVSRRGTDDVEMTETCMDPAPVNEEEADASSGCCRFPDSTIGVAGCGWTSAATLETSAGAAVVVVVGAVAVVAAVVVGALSGRPTARVPSVALVVGAGNGEVGGVTVLGPCPGSVVVVAVVGGGAVGLLWWELVDSSGAVSLRPDAFGWDEVAATRARRETDTARTAHQCGRIRGVGTPPTALFSELSPATA